MTAANFFLKKKWPHTVSTFIPSYSMSFNLSNIGQVFWILILKDWLSLKMNEQGNCCLVITSSTKHEINEEVPCCDHATMAKKCTKKCVLDWIVFILVWFERSLHSTQVSEESCPWPLKLMTSQRVERTWIRTGGYSRFRGEWVNEFVKCAMTYM